LRKASEPADRTTTPRKATNSKQILALQTEVTELRETLTEILKVVKGNAKLLESLQNSDVDFALDRANDVIEKVKENKHLVVTDADIQKASDSAELEAMNDLINENEEFGNIVTSL